MNKEAPLIKIKDGQIYRQSMMWRVIAVSSLSALSILCFVLLQKLAQQVFDPYAWYTPIIGFVALCGLPSGITMAVHSLGDENLLWRKIKPKGIPLKERKNPNWRSGPIKSL